MFDLEGLFRFAAAFALVIGMIALLAYAAKRWRGIASVSGSGVRRMQIVEAIGVDAKRRLVIVRADGADRLLLLGGATDLDLGPLAAPKDNKDE